MAKAGKKNLGPGADRNRGGASDVTELPPGILGENDVLSNRDKAAHAQTRGQDGRYIQTQQYQDHVGARRQGAPFDEEPPKEGE